MRAVNMNKRIIISLAILFCLVNVMLVNAYPKENKLTKVGKTYGSSQGSNKWSPNADLNHDGIVDVNDLALASKKTVKTSKRTNEMTQKSLFATESNSPTISVEPDKTIVGSPEKIFTIDINITDAPDTWAWQFNLTWDPSVLNITNITEGTFLSQGGDTYLVNNTNYTEGWAFIGNTLLDPALPVSGDGTLASINFTVLDLGSSTLHLEDTALLAYNLTNYTHSTEDGEFVVCLGDVNADGIVDIFDIGSVSAHWFPGPPIGPLGYDPIADLNNDGSVDIYDIGIVSANWGTTC